MTDSHPSSRVPPSSSTVQQPSSTLHHPPLLLARQNLNRRYMKLEVWQRGVDLFERVFATSKGVADFELRSQINDAAQSVSANIAEGYCRRSLPEYIQFLYIAKGSLGECLTRAIGLQRVGLLSVEQFGEIDTLHYEVENKLLGLIRAMEAKRSDDSWDDTLPAPHQPQSPNHHPSSTIHPPPQVLPHPSTTTHHPS